MTVIELQHQSEIADARLEVAEDLGWIIGILCAIATHLKWDNWFLNITLIFVVYFLVTYRYRQIAAKAQDDYYRVAHLGKYGL